MGNADHMMPDCCRRDPEQGEHRHPAIDNLSTLREVLSIMREARATRVKLPALEVELSPLAFALPSAPTIEDKQEPGPIGLEHGGPPTDDQLLMWSTPGDLPAAQQEPR